MPDPSTTPAGSPEPEKKKRKPVLPPHEGMTLIFRASKKLPDGTVIWAKTYGLKAWPIWVDASKDTEPS